MSEPVRLLISDVDGTLVRKDKSLGPPVIEAVKRLRDAGLKVTLISARPLSGMLQIAKTLGIEAPMGAFNGGTIAKPDGTIISAERLSRDAVKTALEQFDLPWVTIWLFADNRWHTTSTDNPHTDSERVTAAQEPVIVKDFAELMDRVDKIVAVSDEEPKLAALEKTAAKALGDTATVARSQTYYLDVTAPKANKGLGVTILAKALDVPLSATAVIGDGQNDIRMFDVAGLSVAMGNGSDEVRAAADHVTKSNAEDGVAYAIDTFILPAADKGHRP